MVPVGVAILGFVFLMYGLVNLRTQAWAHATGVVGHCTAQTVKGSGTSRHVNQVCDVTWSADGPSHAATVNLGAGQYRAGQAVELRVNGDEARPDDPAWLGYGGVGVGVLLFGTAAYIGIAARRATRRAAPQSTPDGPK